MDENVHFNEVLFLLAIPKQDQESISALLPAGPTPCSCLNHSQKKNRNLSLLTAKTAYAKQGPIPGQVAVCRHRTIL